YTQPYCAKPRLRILMRTKFVAVVKLFPPLYRACKLVRNRMLGNDRELKCKLLSSNEIQPRFIGAAELCLRETSNRLLTRSWRRRCRSKHRSMPPYAMA